MHAEKLSSADIGGALATQRGLSPKRGVKQVDRLAGNELLEMEPYFSAWMPWIIGSRANIVASIDWTDYDRDG